MQAVLLFLLTQIECEAAVIDSVSDDDTVNESIRRIAHLTELLRGAVQPTR